MNSGWKTVKLGEVCSFERGLTYSKSDEADAPGITVLRANNVDLTSGQLNLDDLRYISAKVAVHEKKYLSANSIIVCTASGSRAHLGKTAHISKPPRMTFGGFMGLLRPSPEIDSRFLFYLTRSDLYRSLISGLSSGTNINNLKGSDLLSWEIPLPPLAEQKRIVALLDEAFAGIDEAKAKAEESLNRIHALFESHLQAIFTQRGPGWVERRLGEVSRINYGYTESASAEMIGPHFLRITDIQDEGVDWSTVPYCRIDKDDLPKYKLSDGDIVFARTGATTGKSYLVSNPPDSVFASYLIRVQLSEKALLPGFLYLFFQTRSYWDVIRAGVSGSAQGGFNASKLGELTVAYPVSLSEQNILIRSISDIQADTLMAGKLAKEKLQALAELEASILAQAFAGEITA